MYRIGVTEHGDGGLCLDEVLEAIESHVVDGAIIITKDPGRILEVDLPSNVIVHCTITGFGDSALEPHVPPATFMLTAYLQLLEKYGGERVVLRVDPIFDERHSLSIARMAADTSQHGRFRISFFDAYPHVLHRMGTWKCLTKNQRKFHLPLERRKDIVKELIGFRKKQDIEICGEPGLACTGCISARDLKAMGLVGKLGICVPRREACACPAEKVELLNQKGRCNHGCLYCYWKD